MVGTEPKGPWLLLIHQIPPAPAYLRVRIWRKLQSLGAVAIKNSVYVLPATEEAREDFEWVVREVTEQGGEASLCEARFVEGLRDDQVEALFHAARDADYGRIVEEAQKVGQGLRGGRGLVDDARARLQSDVIRLRRQLAEIVEIDFFAAPGRDAAETAIARLEIVAAPPSAAAARLRRDELRGKVWVTRRGIHVDRIASAWLIRRFIDPRARFKFVAAKGYRPEAGEVRFDMFAAEFTHERDLCTFEILLERVELTDPALRPIAEIVHDVDLKDGKFQRIEAPGIDRLIAGLAMAHKDDDDRLARGRAIFDDLYEYFRRKRDREGKSG